MAWETFRSNDGAYLIDWEGLARIIRSCKRAGAMNDYSRAVVEKGERDWWALGLKLPDLHSVQVDWDKVALETTTRTEMELRRFYAAAKTSMRPQLAALIHMMEQADDDRDAFKDKQSEAQQKTADNIESAVHKGEIAVDIATHVRNTSADVVMVGATFVTGGAAGAIGLTALGSGMKGAFEYQDTRKVGKALATFSTNFILGVADVKAGAAIKGISSKSARIGMTIAWAHAKAVLSFPTGLIEGKTMAKAASGMGVKLISSTGPEAGIELLKDHLNEVLGESGEGWAIPVVVGLELAEDRLADAIAESGENKGEGKVKETNGPPAHLPHPHGNHRTMDAVVYDASVIEQTAVRQIGSGPNG